ncbi:Na+/H+ antiporter NhaC family protein [Blastopirellula marina]|uniref:Na+/H+ antiporter NhaC-like C-terminal domain-containing protein n=1 Tax=Blastopirellula marina TaxID=124 RepID=A0A2S8F830_9BACT|nr:Na+/H+ antiporter NhaC family protein [Blastopirellula marina]PQO28322.1 hypothetical protein C5Y98_25850 [Blastopirellula marina]PTL41862.1 hypothetical protein C5Y97_25865 [Blastopirellula marina]
MDPHPFGWYSLIPPLTAILLAIVTRRTVLSLFVGILVGGIILAHGHPLSGGWIAAKDFIWAKFWEDSKQQVFAFTLLIGGMIGLVSESGGIRGLVNLIVPWAYTRVRGQVTTWLMGLLIFFDDYANSLLLGGTMREVTDRLKISREKLAYIIDSTAAPVSGLALVSTWVAAEIGYIQDGVDQITSGTKPEAFQLFLESIPYRFYTWWALLLVPLVALLKRDFGPMLTAEVNILRDEGNTSDAPGSNNQHSQETNWIDRLTSSLSDRFQLKPESPLTSNWVNAAIPVGTLLLVVILVLFYTGYQKASLETESPSILQIAGAGESNLALLYGSGISLIVAFFLIAPQRLLSGKQLGWSIVMGMKSMAPAIFILWFAAALSAETAKPSENGLGTAEYLKTMISSNLSVEMLPSATFLLAAAVAFSTGTSWGTMGILAPISISLSHSMLVPEGGVLDPHDPILLTVVGSVLSGAIFGDHCSPISDTTILSSQSCGCNHVAHVRTQMPYAILGAVASVIAGTLPIGLGVPVFVCHILGIGVLIGTMYTLGRDAEVVAAQSLEPALEVTED